VALAVPPRPDTPTLLTEEFLAVINNYVFFREAVHETEAPGILTGIEVIKRAGGTDKLVEELKQLIGEERARKVVSLLSEQPGRSFDHAFERDKFIVYIEIKSTEGNWDYVWKEAVQDAYHVPVLSARGQRGWQKEILVWFIPSTIADKGDFPKVIKYLRSKGVVVITTTEVNSVLATINEARAQLYVCRVKIQTPPL